MKDDLSEIISLLHVEVVTLDSTVVSLKKEVQDLKLRLKKTRKESLDDNTRRIKKLEAKIFNDGGQEVSNSL